MTKPEDHKNICPAQMDFTQIVSVATQNLPAMPQESDLQGRIFDTRQNLIHMLKQACFQDFEHITASVNDVKAEADALELENAWRSMLPPLLLPKVRKVSRFSAWRSAVIAILGLLLGMAFGQALLGIGIFPEAVGTAVNLQGTGQATEFYGAAYQSTGLVVLCALMGAMALLWFAEYLVQAKNSGMLFVFNKRYAWKRFAKLCSLSFGFILVLAIVRDFFSGKIGFLHLIQSLGTFLHEGHSVAFFSNIYGVLIFCFVFSLFLHRPLSFDHQDFEDKLHTSVCQWWAATSCIGPLLLENLAFKKDRRKAAWHKVGVELYSLAGELPEARKDWMETRLRKVGIEAQREEGLLTWEQALEEQYTPLGHIALGDACYVDEPPVFEHGVLARKGTVRKVRK